MEPYTLQQLNDKSKNDIMASITSKNTDWPSTDLYKNVFSMAT